jgi:hypothetical protein
MFRQTSIEPGASTSAAAENGTAVKVSRVKAAPPSTLLAQLDAASVSTLKSFVYQLFTSCPIRTGGELHAHWRVKCSETGGQAEIMTDDRVDHHLLAGVAELCGAVRVGAGDKASLILTMRCLSTHTLYRNGVA